MADWKELKALMEENREAYLMAVISMETGIDDDKILSQAAALWDAISEFEPMLSDDMNNIISETQKLVLSYRIYENQDERSLFFAAFANDECVHFSRLDDVSSAKLYMNEFTDELTLMDILDWDGLENPAEVIKIVKDRSDDYAMIAEGVSKYPILHKERFGELGKELFAAEVAEHEWLVDLARANILDSIELYGEKYFAAKLPSKDTVSILNNAGDILPHRKLDFVVKDLLEKNKKDIVSVYEGKYDLGIKKIAETLIEKMGADRAKDAIALMIPPVAWDGRIFDTVKQWAEERAETMPQPIKDYVQKRDGEVIPELRTDKIHIGHLGYIANEMRQQDLEVKKEEPEKQAPPQPKKSREAER